MTADELLASLLGSGSARVVPTAPPLTGGAQLAGIEIVTTAVTAEGPLRRAWRDRHGGGATPVLLVANDPARAGSVLALGVTRGDGALRSVEASALGDVLARIAARPRLDAIRELASELERLDLSGIPGLALRGLLTMHTLDVRLRGDASRWAGAQEATKSVSRTSDWREVLVGLGYELERRPRRGHLARFEGKPVLVVHPKADPSEFARLADDGRPAEGVLLNDCQADGAPFGALASGGRMRLFAVDRALGSAAADYVELDAERLQLDDLPFLVLLGPGYLASGGFDDLETEARRYGAELRKRIDSTIRQDVLPILGRSLGNWAVLHGRDPADDKVRQDLEHAALTLIFRLLFVFYAESAGYLPTGNRSYRRHSLTALVEEASATTDQLSTKSTALWLSFVQLVKALRLGNPAWERSWYRT